MRRADLLRIVTTIQQIGWVVADDPEHGERHWRCVAWNGIELAKRTPGADPLVAFLFGLCHDAMRTDGGEDYEHGPRAAEMVANLYAGGHFKGLTHTQFEWLHQACTIHTEAQSVQVPHLGVCLDADRLCFWRYESTPKLEYLSTSAAAELRFEPWVMELHADPPTWEAAIDSLPTLVAAP